MGLQWAASPAPRTNAGSSRPGPLTELCASATWFTWFTWLPAGSGRSGEKHWFSELVRLLTAAPWPIPLRRDLLSQVNGTIWHPHISPQWWHYVPMSTFSAWAAPKHETHSPCLSVKSIKEEVGPIVGQRIWCITCMYLQTNTFGSECCLLRQRGRPLACRRLPILPESFVGGASTGLRENCSEIACLLPGSVCPAHALLSARHFRVKRHLGERPPWWFM